MFISRLLAISMFCLPIFGHAADATAELKRFLSAGSSLQGQFNQTVLPRRSGEKPQSSSGNFAVMRPGKFRWAYAKPYEQLIVGDGSQVWLYDPDLKQVTIKRISAALDASPAALLAGDQVDKLYQLRNLPDRDGLAWLEAIPRDHESTFKKVEIGLRTGQLATMTLYDQFGQTTKVEFSALNQNNKPDQNLFRFTPPKDVDVVRE